MFFTPCPSCSKLRKILEEAEQTIRQHYQNVRHSNCQLDELPKPNCNLCQGAARILTPEAADFLKHIIDCMSPAVQMKMTKPVNHVD